MKPRLTPIIVKAPQRSSEWFNARLGNVTGSKADLTMDYSKPTVAQLKEAIKAHEDQGIDEGYIEEMSEKYPVEFCLEIGIELRESAGRKGYKEGIVAERFSGMPADLDPYITKDMLWGQNQEIFARHKYQELTDNIVQEAPLMLHPEWLCGASPDGLVVDSQTGELGNLEIKCLKTKNHMYKVLKAKKAPDEYITQIQMQMWIDGRDWCDFVGFDSRLDEGLQIYICRVRRDDFFIENVLIPSIKRFLDECDHDQRVFYAIMKSMQERLKNKISLDEEGEL